MMCCTSGGLFSSVLHGRTRQDITSTLFRVELLMGRDIAYDLANHKKLETAAQLAKLADPSTRKIQSNKTSKVGNVPHVGIKRSPYNALGQGCDSFERVRDTCAIIYPPIPSQ